MNNETLVNIVTAGSTLAKSGAGHINGLVINKSPVAALKLYDAASIGAVVSPFATIAAADAAGPYPYVGKLANGLVVINGDAVRAVQTLTSDATAPADGETVTIDTVVYTYKTALSEAFATGIITSNNTNVSDGDLVRIGLAATPATYRFKTTPVQINDIKIGATADLSLTNLSLAINGTGTSANYWPGTETRPLISASTVTAHAITLTARALGAAANSILVSKTAATLTLSGLSSGALSGGVNAVANEVLIGASAAVALDNLKDAINLGTIAGTQGTTYSTGTLVHPSVTATTNTNTTQVVQAINYGTAGNSIATTETSAHLSWGAATLATGVEGSTFDITVSVS